MSEKTANVIVPPKTLPSLTPLVVDFWNDFPKVSSFFGADFRDWKSYAAVADRVRQVGRPYNHELVSILREQNESYSCSRQTLKNLETLAGGKALAVVTGQQVGLFSGPLYTIYKALTIIKLAQELSHRLDAPVLPIFYLVSEDHDFAEVQWAGLIDSTNKFRRVFYRPAQASDRLPVFQLKIEESINQVIKQLADSLPDTEFKQEIISQLMLSYQSGTGFALGFARWFTRLFSQYGVIILDASDPRLKRLVSPIFERELKENLSSLAISKTDQLLTSFGYHSQLAIQPNRPNVFVLKDGRHSIERDGVGYRNLNSGQMYSIAELIANPEQISPKAALRPIVEDTLLPTIAYVGGPGEIAYWAQLRGTYEAFDLPMPVVVPRAGFTLVEPKIKRHLERFSMSAAQVIVDPAGAENQALHSLIPPDFGLRIKDSKTAIEKEWRRLSNDVRQIEPSMGNAIDKMSNQMTHQINALEEKILKALKQREGIFAEQLKSVTEHLVPDKKLQERQLNIVPFLIKYDWSIIDKLFSAINVHQLEHQLLEL
jgi:bacillithiol biosynthesis cysteine-adding enzyme BshC